MRSFSKTALCALAGLCGLALATPASASVTINFTGGSSGTDGTDGNIRTFTSGGLSVQASAWSYDGSTLESAFLGWYGNGLGVTNNDEGSGGNNSHAIDNYGQRDFVLLVFNQAVNLSSAVLRPYAQTTAGADNDAEVAYTNVAGIFTTPATALSTGNPLFATLNGSDWTVAGNMGSGNLTNLGSAGLFGNVWLIGGAETNPDSRYDGFKLSSITATSAVPEPGTWAMMLLGFGLAGAALRRKGTELLPQIA